MVEANGSKIELNEEEQRKLDEDMLKFYETQME